MTVKILFLADTHIGLDWPQRPRVRRRRRGDDFWNNYLTALKPAFLNQVDLVIHGGDVLYRSRVPKALLQRAFEPLLEIAHRGIPVYVIPGNHERSFFKIGLFERHPHLHIFDRPRTFIFQKKHRTLALGGFPYVRGDIRRQLKTVLEQSGLHACQSLPRLLCFHQAVDGATVGPDSFMFHNRPDTIDPLELDGRADLALSGHIHRHQLLTRNHCGNPLPVPVLYSGSVERTSGAERSEPKGYTVIHLQLKRDGGVRWKYQFIQLPARPWVRIRIQASSGCEQDVIRRIENRLIGLEFDSIVDIGLSGYPGKPISQEQLRRITPSSMNVRLYTDQK